MIGIPLEERTVAHMFARARADDGDAVFIATAEASYTYAESAEIIARLAAGLSARGIGPGERIALMMDNSPDLVFLLIALAHVAAVALVLNTESKGQLLEFYLRDSQSTRAIVDERHSEAFAGPAAAVGMRDIARRDPGSWLSEMTNVSEACPERAEPSFSDVFVYIYTSGTTGPPKAVGVTHAQAITTGSIFSTILALTAADRLYTCLPLFHINAIAYTLCGALSTGASIALGPRFSARRFWSDVGASGATQLNAMGSMLHILRGQAPAPAEREHSVSKVFLAPLPPKTAEVAARYGIEFATTYAQTEWLPSSLSAPGEGYERAGGAGPILPYSEVRVVDEQDRVLEGGRGEIVLRAHEPYVTFGGYLGRPEESLHAFRNLRFHTGDLGEIGADGWLYFRGRVKDVIRRRGENISCAMVEEILTSHPDIAEAVAVPVPATISEEEVFVYVSLRENAEMSPDGFLSFAREAMPRYMVPLYVDFRRNLPTTATNKVARQTLKHEAAQQVQSGASRALY